MYGVRSGTKLGIHVVGPIRYVVARFVSSRRVGLHRRVGAIEHSG